MSGQKLNRLQYKNYLSVINGLPNTQIFRHLYVVDENNREFDAVNDGDKSCALVVSSILLLFGWIDCPHATVKSTIKALIEKDWHITSNPKPGDIVIYPSGKSGHEHIGFFLSDNTVVSNVSAKHFPDKHGLMMSDGRSPAGYYTRNYNKVD